MNHKIILKIKSFTISHKCVIIKEKEKERKMTNKKIRRYDIFAITEYLKNLQKGLPEDVAKGDAIWLATLIASRKFSRGKVQPRTVNGKKDKKLAEKNGIYTSKWRMLSGKPQTDKVYDKNIIQRMGEDLYQIVLNKVKELFEAGLDYMDYRDSVREELTQLLESGEMNAAA